MNLSPICELSKTSLASWRPSVKSTYDSVSANPRYLDDVQGPLRLKYPNDMAGKELITQLTEVLPKTLIWYFFVFKGKPTYNAYEKDIAVVNIFFGDSTVFG